MAWEGLKVVTHYSKDPENPPITDALGDKAHDERCKRHADGDEECPNTHKPRALELEIAFGDDSATQSASGADEEGNQCSACSQGCVSGRLGTANVADQATNKRNEENGTTAVAVGNWFPEEWRDAENGNLQRGEIGDLLETDAKVLGNVQVRWDNG